MTDISNLPVPPTQTVAEATVGSVLSEAQGMATTAVAEGMAVIQALGNVVIDIPEVVVPPFTVPAITLPPEGVAPTPAGLDATFDTPPPAPERAEGSSPD